MADSLPRDEWALDAGVPALHDLCLDFDDAGQLVGIEVANARNVLPAELLEQAE